MKKYTFFAKTNPLFVEGLKSELRDLVGLDKLNLIKLKSLNYIRFELPMNKVWKIILYSRIIEEMKILVKENIVIKYF